jgi:hypothetical protein
LLKRDLLFVSRSLRILYSFSMMIDAEVSGSKDPGTEEMMLTGKVAVLCKVSTVPAVTLTMTVPAAVDVDSAGKSVNEEKVLPGTGTSFANNVNDQAGTGAGKGGVN